METKCIKDVDEETWKDFRSLAIKNNMKMSILLKIIAAGIWYASAVTSNLSIKPVDVRGNIMLATMYRQSIFAAIM